MRREEAWTPKLGEKVGEQESEPRWAECSYSHFPTFSPAHFRSEHPESRYLGGYDGGLLRESGRQ